MKIYFVKLMLVVSFICITNRIEAISEEAVRQVLRCRELKNEGLVLQQQSTVLNEQIKSLESQLEQEKIKTKDDLEKLNTTIAHLKKVAEEEENTLINLRQIHKQQEQIAELRRALQSQQHADSDEE